MDMNMNLMNQYISDHTMRSTKGDIQHKQKCSNAMNMFERVKMRNEKRRVKDVWTNMREETA